MFANPRITALIALLAVGCGSGAPSDQPDLGTVTGKVTLDGAPLPNATVTFQPDSGRASRGTTDENGMYELTYSRSTRGAKIGDHTVSVTTAQVDADGKVSQEEKVPTAYQGGESMLKKSVKSGSNDIPLELDSGASEVVQPDQEGTGGGSRVVGC